MQEREGVRGAVRRLEHQGPTSHEVGMRETLTRTRSPFPVGSRALTLIY
jgi:hypothetical protein